MYCVYTLYIKLYAVFQFNFSESTFIIRTISKKYNTKSFSQYNYVYIFILLQEMILKYSKI